MSEALVPTIRTTPTMRSFALALLRVWPEATKEAAGIVWAHFAGETADGHHCYGWNLGNVKWTKGCGLDYQALRGVWEIDRKTGQRLELEPTDPGAWFRVYPSFEAGMTTFVNSKRTGQWKSAWPFVVAGDAEGYARELNRLRYYTAPVATYVASMKAKLATWMASSAFDEALDELRPTEPAIIVQQPDFATVHPWHFHDGEPPGAT